MPSLRRILITIDSPRETVHTADMRNALRHPYLILTACAFAFMAARMLAAEPATDDKLIFHDSLKDKLGPGWTWVREDSKHWRIGQNGLEVHVQPGNMWGPANNARNLLVRPAPDHQNQAMEITASISNHPTSQYEQVDLVWYYDDSNMVKIGQELVNKKLSIVIGREQNDKTRTIAIIPLDSDDVQLQFIVSSDKIRGRFKTPNADWRDAGQCDLPVKGQPNISMQFYQGPANEEHWARVSDFMIRRAQ